MKKIQTSDGRTIVRLSRWIKVHTNYAPSKRNALWDYVRDGYGYGPYSDKFDPGQGLFLDYFRWNGRNWAIEQFYSTSGTIGFLAPMMFENEDGKTSFIAGYDSQNCFNPILIEVDDCGEYVRVYEEA